MSAEEIIVFKAIRRRLRRQRIFANWIYAQARQKGLRQEWNFR